METIGSKRSYALIWCMPNNDDDDINFIMLRMYADALDRLRVRLFLSQSVVKVRRISSAERRNVRFYHSAVTLV